MSYSNVMHLFVNLVQLIFQKNVIESFTTVEEFHVTCCVNTKVHSLNDLIRWSDSCSTSDETKLFLGYDFTHYHEISTSNICYLPKWLAELAFIPNFQSIKILGEFLIGILLSLFIDFDEHVD